MNEGDTLFSYIKTQESNYRQPIRLNDSWSWGMKDHIDTSELYNNSQLKTGKNDFKPVKNITRPILNLQHRAEDIELKDVQLYVDDPDKHHLSLLVKKYHDDVFVKEHDLDTFFDELNVSRIDFGGGLSKKVGKGRETVPLQSIVFCDQTDILSGPIGIKHFYSPDQLLDMAERGWGNTANGATMSLEDVIRLSRDEKKDETNTTKTPGRYIEVYEVHGNLPKKYANPKDTSEKYETRMFIVCFYSTKDNKDKKGVVLYSAVESKSPFKLIKRDPVYGRALGFGGAEELFEPQVWTNYDMIRKQALLDSASKTILKTSDVTLAAKHPTGLKDMDNLEIVEIQQGAEFEQVDTYPRNIALFDKSLNDWEIHAKDIGGAQDPLQGKEPTAGTPFSSLIEQVRQGMGLHEYRRGQFARHIEEIYQDDFIPEIQKEITKGAKFLSELSLDELQYVTEGMVRNKTNLKIKEMVLAGETPTQDVIDQYKELVTQEIRSKGNKHFIEILKGEFKDAPLAIKVVVAGKSKNLAANVDKVTNIFRFAFSNPMGFMQVMQIPGMAKGFNQILEMSGLEPADFSGIEKFTMQPAQPMQSPQEMLPAEMTPNAA